MNTDTPLYELVDKDKSSVEIPNNEYAAMTMTTINRENIYSKPDTSAVGIHGSNDDRKEAGTKKIKRLICILLVIVSVIATLALIAGCFVAVFVEIASLKSERAPQDQTPLSQLMANDSSIMLHLNQLNQSIEERLLQLNGGFYRQLEELVGNLQERNDEIRMHLTQNITVLKLFINESLSSIAIQQQQGNISIQQSLSALNNSFNQQLTTQENVINEINEQLIIQENVTATLRNAFVSIGQYSFSPAVSCSSLPPSSPSGYYWVTTSNGSAVRVYCTRSCGGVTGGWTRVAYLNMTDSSQQCSSHGLIPQTSSGELTCVISNDDAGCSSVTYTTFLPYSKVCGKILAHSTENPDGFAAHFRSGPLTLDSTYVDGVSLTHGEPRQHIWTFAAYCIPCELRRPSFIDDEHYFCAPQLSNPVWDGINDCPPNNPPWFHRELSITTDDIEMRVCRDEGRDNEDIGITHIELYVQ